MPEKLTKTKQKLHNRKHGYLSRTSNASGKKVIKRQRAKGRKSI